MILIIFLLVMADEFCECKFGLGNKYIWIVFLKDRCLSINFRSKLSKISLLYVNEENDQINLIIQLLVFFQLEIK